MARPKHRKRHRSDDPFRCRRCRDLRQESEKFYRGLCPTCLDLDKRRRRSDRGRRQLAKAKDGGTVERNGQTFKVVRL